ncbi:MAG: YccF domain-containing protein, partial [Gammaproteobacteria bacterium]
MRAIGNLLWFVLGGIVMGLAWWFAGLIAFVTIIGIPWGRACFVIGKFSFFPFGKEAIRRDELTQKKDIGTGVFGVIGRDLCKTSVYRVAINRIEFWQEKPQE